MGAKFEKAGPRLWMGYIHYEPWIEREDDESARRLKRLEHALTELGFVTTQLRHITDRLVEVGREEVTEENVAWCLEELGYHGGYYLNTAYEIQDRLAGLLAILTGNEKDKLIGRLRAYKDGRMPLYVQMQKRAPQIARQFLRIESAICSLVNLRRVKTHEACLHFEFFVDKHPYDPAEILSGAKDEAQFGELVRVMREEVRRFINRHQKVCKEIEGRAERLEEAVRQAEGMDT